MGGEQGTNNKPATPLGLLVSDNEGSLICINIRNYTPTNMSNPRRPESSNTAVGTSKLGKQTCFDLLCRVLDRFKPKLQIGIFFLWSLVNTIPNVDVPCNVGNLCY
jgi:hypothetical protein